MIQNRDTGTGALQLLGFTLHTPASSTGLALNMIGIQGLGGGPRESSKLSTKGNFMGGKFYSGGIKIKKAVGTHKRLADEGVTKVNCDRAPTRNASKDEIWCAGPGRQLCL